MDRKEMITKFSEKSKITKKSAEVYIDDLFDVIMDAVANDNPVKIVGFGTFSKKLIKGRTGKMNFGKNKGQEYKSEDSFTAKFKVGKIFEDRTNGIFEKDKGEDEKVEEDE